MHYTKKKKKVLVNIVDHVKVCSLNLRLFAALNVIIWEMIINRSYCKLIHVSYQEWKSCQKYFNDKISWPIFHKNTPKNKTITIQGYELASKLTDLADIFAISVVSKPPYIERWVHVLQWQTRSMNKIESIEKSSVKRLLYFSRIALLLN